MADELLFNVVGASARPAEPISLADAGLRERADLQEWVLAHPDIIGDGVKIVTFEFDRWWTASGSAPLDRLDVLGLDRSGTLVVAELKRDRAPDTTEMQAVKYAAMASRFTLESLAEQHARFCAQPGEPGDNDEALAALIEHAPDLSMGTLRRPRIVLLARDFPPVVTATVVWLTEMGLDITLQRFQAYRSTVPAAGEGSSTQILVSVSQLYPVRDVEEFTVSPAQTQVRAAAQTKKRTQDVSAVRRLADAEAVPDGTQFRIVVRDELGAEQRADLEVWLEEDSRRSIAIWSNDPTSPLTWAVDKTQHSPSGLVRVIVRHATGQDRSFYGTHWWVDQDGRSLVEHAAGLTGSRGELYRLFWTEFLRRVTTDNLDWTKSTSPPTANWFPMPSGIRGTYYAASFAAGKRLRNELYLDTGDKTTTLALFHQIRSHRKEVEEVCGGVPVNWEELPNRRASRIALYRDGEVNNIDEHEQHITWLIDTGTLLRKAIGAVAPPPRSPFTAI